jgi:hypothetical protein
MSTGKSRLRSLTIALLSLLVIAAAGLLAVWVATDSKPSGPQALKVQGHLLRDGKDRYILSGVTMYALPFYTDSGGAADAPLTSTTAYEYAHRVEIFAAMKQAGANTVRIALGTAGYDTDVYGLSKTEYVQRAQNLVAAAKAASLRVIFAWWDSLGFAADLPAKYMTTFPMMTDIYRVIGADSAVTYEPFNEPNAISWDQWLPVAEATVKFWREQLGYHGVLWLDTTGYSWDFDPKYATQLLASDPKVDGTPQIVFANHRYANLNTCFCGSEKAGWIAAVGQYVSRYPIAGTEYGWWDGAGFTPMPSWNAQLYDYIVDTAVPAGYNGAAAFVWDWIDLNTMTQAGGLKLNSAGALISGRLLRPLLAAGRVPSPGSTPRVS